MGNPFEGSVKLAYLREFRHPSGGEDAGSGEFPAPSTENSQLSSWIFDKEVHVTSHMAEAIASPRSLSIYLLMKYGEWDQLINLPINPMDYLEPERFRDDYQITRMMQKNPRIPVLVDKREVALRRFREAEAACSETNIRFTAYMEGKFLPLRPEVQDTIERAKDLLNVWLGELDRHRLEEIQRCFRFGPGATSSVTGRKISPSEKYLARVDATPRLLPYCSTIIGAGSWFLSSGQISERGYSKVTTVPKDARTDRCICIEPHMNIYVQLGIGQVLKNRLRVNGLDLRTSWERNQFLAQKAFKTGLATIDLSSASDTIAKRLVEYLLSGGFSTRWLELLRLCRTDVTLAPDSEEFIPLEKWSSMGNGYTFELETMIFLSLVRAIVPRERWGDCAVFGDDIILPREYVPLLKSVLEFCGFSMNREKSFWQGVFFESCGKDFFAGREVRPFFLKGDYVNKDDFLIKTANSIRRWSAKRAYVSCDKRLFPIWFQLFRWSSERAQRCRIPDGYGDSGFIGNFDESSARIKPLRSHPDYSGWEGWSVNVLIFRRTAVSCAWRGYLAYQLATLERRSIRSSQANIDVVDSPPLGDCLEIRRCSKVVPQYTSSAVLYWTNLGPWA